MYIGLIDYDLVNQTSIYPNLEIMKLSGYYKSQRIITELVKNCADYQMYQRIYLRQDYDGDMPRLLMSRARNKLDYGGHAFFGDKYIELEKEIEQSEPDPTIYLKTPRAKKTGPFKTCLRSYYCMRLGNYNPDIVRSKERILLYDRDIGENSDNFFELANIAGKAKKIHLISDVKTTDLNLIQRIDAIPNLAKSDIKYTCDYVWPAENLEQVANIKGTVYIRAFDNKVNNISEQDGFWYIYSQQAYLREIIANPHIRLLQQFKNQNLNTLLSIFNSGFSEKNKLWSYGNLKNRLPARIYGSLVRRDFK